MDDYDNAEALSAQFHSKLSGMGQDGGNAGGGRGGKSRGGRRGGRGGGRSGGGGFQSREKDISHALSKLLRHQAASAGIPLDKEGYAPLELVLKWGTLRNLKVTVSEVRNVIATNDKQRFAWKLKDGSGDASLLDTSDDAADFVIRANQGHSIASVTSDAGLLTPIDDPETAPPVVCHGTFFSFWPAIVASGGLKRMTRNHVHMGCLEDAALLNKAPIPGLRRDAQIMVYIDVRRALREDPALKWWRAANGVVLSEGNADGVVPAKFFQRVVTSPHGSRLLPGSTELLLWEAGSKVADLPADVLSKARAPAGKAAMQRRAETKPRAGSEASTPKSKTPSQDELAKTPVE
ncbi:tpt1 family rna 2 -phosphotransferase [Ophiostoma piceae UAMH 11346]|uniref:2'-phosphotransferase n=1 Tax=Ophiostoma piceae (strain UAMH 11346) TaxID=1262450 RepID=S3BQ70_OPHP1|nr:tpt1 family rna 2 -phosphotransferase [Ophiostoma piceae UAMH 11346]